MGKGSFSFRRLTASQGHGIRVLVFASLAPGAYSGTGANPLVVQTIYVLEVGVWYSVVREIMGEGVDI